MQRKRAILGLTAAALSSGIAFAQGANDCANAQPINAVGTYAFDNTMADTDGAADCNGQPTRKDVWFDFTAPLSTGYRMTLCGGTTLDTRAVVYDGNACPPTTVLDCATSNCSLQSVVSWAAVAGNHYLIRIGSRAVGTSGTGTFDIEETQCPVAMDDGLEENDTCDVAVPMTDGSYPGLFVHKQDPDYYGIQIADGATIQLDILFTHTSGDIDTFLYDSCGPEIASSATGNDDEQIIFTNNTGCTIDAQLRVEHWVPDTQADCNNYDLIIMGSGPGTPCGGPGTNYCTSTVNSTGMASTISGTGSASISANDLVLTADNLPSQPGIFIAGPTQAQIPFFNGFLCVDPNGLQRFVNVASPSGGTITEAVDLATAALGGLNAMSGSSYYYQRWNRDPAAGGGNANFSDGYDVLYAP